MTGDEGFPSVIERRFSRYSLVRGNNFFSSLVSRREYFSSAGALEVSSNVPVADGLCRVPPIFFASLGLSRRTVAERKTRHRRREIRYFPKVS